MYRGLRRLLLCGTGSGSALTVVVSVTLWYGLACCNKCIESGFAHPSAKTPLEKHWQPSPILGGGGVYLFVLPRRAELVSGSDTCADLQVFVGRASESQRQRSGKGWCRKAAGSLRL